MAYTQFTSRQIEKQFNIKYKAEHLFKNIKPVSPSTWLNESIQRARLLGYTSEKSRSERLVSPLLTELSFINNNIFTIYSGLNLDVDDKLGLNGVPIAIGSDFVLSFSKIQDFIKTPIFSIVEAKKHDIELGTIQCPAQLIAAQILNKEDNPKFNNPIYGCSTNGVEWRFIKLIGKDLIIDIDRYLIVELEKLLGVLQTIVDELK